MTGPSSVPAKTRSTFSSRASGTTIRCRSPGWTISRRCILACAFDVKMAERRRGEVQQLITHMNEQMWIGISTSGRMTALVMFRHALVLAGGVEPSDEQCKAVLGPHSIPASATFRRSSSCSGPASRRAKRSTPPCSRRPAGTPAPAAKPDRGADNLTCRLRGRDAMHWLSAAGRMTPQAGRQ